MVNSGHTHLPFTLISDVLHGTAVQVLWSTVWNPGSHDLQVPSAKATWSSGQVTQVIPSAESLVYGGQTTFLLQVLWSVVMKPVGHIEHIPCGEATHPFGQDSHDFPSEESLVYAGHALHSVYETLISLGPQMTMHDLPSAAITCPAGQDLQDPSFAVIQPALHATHDIKSFETLV